MSQQQKKVLWSTLIGVSVFLFLRRPDAILSPQFWAEDGVIFFKQSLENGPSFFIPHAGYLHLIPRIVAFFSSFASICIIPNIYNYFSVITTIFVASKIMSERWHIPYKPLISLSIILVPHSGEIFSNITNLQWITSILILILVLQDNPKNYLQTISDFSLLLLVGLTGPFVVLFLPLIIYRLFLRGRNPYNYAIIFLSIILACTQTYFMINSNCEIPGNQNLNIDHWINVIANRLAGTIFFGAVLSEGLNRKLLLLLTVVLIFFIIYSIKDCKSKEYPLIFMIAGVSIFLAVCYKFREIPEILIPFNNGDRYFYLPRLLIVWSLIVSLKHYNRYVKIASATILTIILFSSLIWYPKQKYVDYKWKIYCERIDRVQNTTISIPINPDGWFIHLNGKQE